LHKHPSILAEEPIGIVGAANLLHDSNISHLIAKLHHAPGFDGRLRRPVTQVNTTRKKSKTPNTDDCLLDRECWVERQPDSWRVKIVVGSEAVDAECTQPFHDRAYSAHQRIPDPYSSHAIRYVTE
jgi:hypothetical protein